MHLAIVKDDGKDAGLAQPPRQGGGAVGTGRSLHRET